MSRATSSASICFALIVCPVKLYLAASSDEIRFNLLSPKSKARVRQQLLCSATNEVVERQDCLQGYEYAKNQYVVFSKDELKSLEGERSSSIDIQEFVPLIDVDFIQVEKSYYLGPDKGSDKAYRLLAITMKERGLVAVGKWQTRGKDQLVIIRPYLEGLVLHQLFYANEVRQFEDLPATVPIRDDEKALAAKLIKQFESNKFDASKYYDEYKQRIAAAVEEKAAGQAINVLPARPAATVVDLIEALKASLDKAKPQQSKPIKKQNSRKRAV